MLPRRYDNVKYYFIGGMYSFAGDLVVSSRAIWFFPHTDPEAQRNKKSLWAQLWGFPAVIVQETISSFMSAWSPHLMTHGLWPERITDSEFQKRAEAFLEERREEEGIDKFSNLLPAPVRFTPEEITCQGPRHRGLFTS
jgi:hypothetical protein